jgi:hypothetical protein
MAPPAFFSAENNLGYFSSVILLMADPRYATLSLASCVLDRHPIDRCKIFQETIMTAYVIRMYCDQGPYWVQGGGPSGRVKLLTTYDLLEANWLRTRLQAEAAAHELETAGNGPVAVRTIVLLETSLPASADSPIRLEERS